ncbi:MAG: putative HTH-type transcriptional regulator y4dJ [Caulobacteraceae bacterium]|nr:putative HTH-type transcriptional regulator y4dJ [Caulobacteraceae bacterium]
MGIRQRVAANIKRLRTERELSQEELAHRAGMDRTYISQIERGVKSPTVETLEKVANGLGVTISDLIA